MAFEEKTVDCEVIYKGPVFTFKKYTVEAPRGGVTYRDILEHNGGSVMVAVTDEGKILFINQYRKALEKESLELPAGKIDPGEAPEVTAARELKEETGYTASEVTHLIDTTPTCGYSNEKLYLFLCKGLTPGETDFDDSEDLDLFEYTPDEAVDMVMRGEIEDAKTIIGILYARAAGLI